MANAEQLGTNRHVAGNPGASTRRYVLSSVISARENSRARGLSLVGGELEGSHELGSRLGISEGVRTGLRNDDHVRRGLRDAEPRARPGSCSADDHQVFAVPTAPLALNGEEVSAPAQADRLRVAVRGGHASPGLLRRNRDRQAPAALVAPPLQNAAPTGRSHAGSEAMRSLAAAVAWLIGSLHPSPGPARKRGIRTQRWGNVNFQAAEVLAELGHRRP